MIYDGFLMNLTDFKGCRAISHDRLMRRLESVSLVASVAATATECEYPGGAGRSGATLLLKHSTKFLS